MAEHFLKTWSTPFGAVWDGSKTYEIRKNDRGFKVGDTLRLLETLHPPILAYTGRAIWAEVTWVSLGPDWGLPEGLCVMSIRVVDRKTHADAVQR